MKKILAILGVVAIAAGTICAVEPSFFPNGLSTANGPVDQFISTTTQSGVMKKGDVFVDGDLFVKGRTAGVGSTDGLGIEREIFLAAAAADSDTYKTGIYIATATLLSNTTYIMDRTYFGVQKHPRTVGVSFDVAFASNWCYGLATIYGYDSTGKLTYDTCIASTTDINYTNKAFVYIASATVAVTNWGDSSDRGGGADVTTSIVNLANLCLRIGTGVKIGLKYIPTTTTALMGIENTTAVVGTGITLSPTYSTADFTTDPDGNNREVSYRHNGSK